MKKIKFFLDYHCSPIWVYDENGKLVCNGLPSELSNNMELVEMFNKIQIKYESLFENNKIYFGYKGFSSEIEKQEFYLKIFKAIDLLKSIVGDDYIIQIKLNEDDL